MNHRLSAALADRYRIERKLGAGGMATVYLAHILPLFDSETADAIQMSDLLLDEGVFVTGFGFPVVPHGTARLRCQISAAHMRDDLDHAVCAIRKVGLSIGVIR